MDIDSQAGESLRRELRALKARGCSVLVVNDPDGVDAICRRLGGDDSRVRRRCYVATTTTLASVLDRHEPTPRRGDHLGLIDARTVDSTRSVAAPIQPGDLDETADWFHRIDRFGDDPHADGPDDDRFGELLAAIEATFRRFDDRAPARRPGEYRLCVESLDPFLDDQTASDEEVLSFLEALTSLVRDNCAIGHFHLASTTASDVRDGIEPLFDATIRVRTTESSGVQQRWRLHEAGIETDWLPVSRS